MQFHEIFIVVLSRQFESRALAFVDTVLLSIIFVCSMEVRAHRNGQQTDATIYLLRVIFVMTKFPISQPNFLTAACLLRASDWLVSHVIPSRICSLYTRFQLLNSINNVLCHKVELVQH
jgi:hypothetical protein